MYAHRGHAKAANSGVSDIYARICKIQKRMKIRVDPDEDMFGDAVRGQHVNQTVM